MEDQSIKMLLQSSNPQSVLKGLSTFGEKGTFADLQNVLSFTKSEDPAIRKAANDSAADMILNNMIQHLTQLEPLVRERLGKLLQNLNSDVIERIGKELYSDDEERRLKSLKVLGLLGRNEKIKQIMAKMVKHKDIKMRATAVRLMGKIIEDKDMTPILSLLSDKDIRVRANTIEALEDVANPNAIGLLHRFKKDPSNRIRGNAIKTLWKLGHKDILDDLKEMFASKNHLMRASAAWVIGEVGKGNNDLVNLLAAYSQDSNKLVRENVIKAELKIGGSLADKYLQYLSEKEEIEDVKKSMNK